MNILSNLKVKEKYTIENILGNDLFELNEKNFIKE